MKKILFFKKNIKQRSLTLICCLVILSALLHLSCADVYDKVKEFSPEEVIYPGHFDTIYGNIGYERVEIYLSKAGRVPSNQMNLGKAKKTVVEYGAESLTFDSICSWVSITGLVMPNIYRFKIYTEDEFGDRSTPVEIALTPYTESDKNALSLSTPDVIQSTSSALLEWKSRLSSNLYDVYGYSYAYTDKDGNTGGGSGEGDAVSFFIENVLRDIPISVDVTLKIIPKVGGVSILDTIYRTFITTVVVNGTESVIFLDKPELDAVFKNGFNSIEPIEFSWVRVVGVTDYLLKISDSYSFPEGERTFIVPVGNASSYALTGQDKLDILTLSDNSVVVRPILYWTVVPANGRSDIATQTRMITGKKVIKMMPTGGIGGAIGTYESGVLKLTVNGTDPSMYTTPLNRIINPGISTDADMLTLTFAYKSDYTCQWEFYFAKTDASSGVSYRVTVPKSDEWQEAVYDFGPLIRQHTWGTAANHRLRFDPGDSRDSREPDLPTNRVVYVTNIQLNIY